MLISHLCVAFTKAADHQLDAAVEEEMATFIAQWEDGLAILDDRSAILQVCFIAGIHNPQNNSLHCSRKRIVQSTLFHYFE